jgi:hypothetical protein
MQFDGNMVGAAAQIGAQVMAQQTTQVRFDFSLSFFAFIFAPRHTEHVHERILTYLLSTQWKSYVDVSALRAYFTLTNSYVMKKLKILFFPFLHKDYSRQVTQTQAGTMFVVPADDVNAPDLYIPTMSLVTYILLIGFILGTASRFTPDVFGMTTSRALGILTAEVLAVKLGFFLLGFAPLSILDVIAYSGYKFPL